MVNIIKQMEIGGKDVLCIDHKQIACVSPSSIIFSSRLNNFKHKLFILFLKFASKVSHLEELMCYDCRFSLEIRR